MVKYGYQTFCQADETDLVLTFENGLLYRDTAMCDVSGWAAMQGTELMPIIA